MEGTMDTGTTDDPNEPEPAAKPKRPRKQKTATELVEQGMNRFGAGRKAQARESFTKALELDPQNADAWFGLALATNDHTEQRAHFQRVLDIDPSHGEARKFVDQLDKLAQAQAHLAQVRAAAPPPPPPSHPVFQDRETHQSAAPARRQSSNQSWVFVLLGVLIVLILMMVGMGGGTAPAPVETYTYSTPFPTYAPIAAPASTGTHRIGAVCNDGSSSGATGRGACSHHGGVQYWKYSK
jgi:hypothetical protein